MRKIISFLVLSFFTASVSMAQPTGGSPSIKIEEEDGAPTGRPRTLKMPNGSLVDNGDNTWSHKFNLANDAWFTATDYSGAGVVNILKANSDDEIELGAALNVGGVLRLPEDGGSIRLVNMNVSSSAADGTDESYTFGVDNEDVVKVRASSDGAGGVDELQFIVAPTIGNNAAKPSLGFGDGDTGFFEGSDDMLNLAVGGSHVASMSSTYIYSVNSAGGALGLAAATSTSPSITFTSDANTGLGKEGADNMSLIAGGVECIRIVENTTISAHIAETTTPTAITGYASIYPKTDDKAYWQDGAGTEHTLEYDRAKVFSIPVTNPAGTEDFLVWRAPAAVTITSVQGCAMDGTSLTCGINECDANGDNAVAITNQTAVTTSNTELVIVNANVQSGDYISFTSTAESGDVTKMMLSVEYTRD